LSGTGVSATAEVAAAAAAGGGAAEDERREASLFMAPSTRETASPALCFGISPRCFFAICAARASSKPVEKARP
jgi:hypothetical protein